MPGDLNDRPEVVGIAEIALILGVGRPRAHRLVRRPDFPEPLSQLRSGSVWLKPEVEQWARDHANRRPGRPRREQ
ncbi:MAG: helix-turn-helix transcriptional regulator [Frankiaceae bacterium]